MYAPHHGRQRSDAGEVDNLFNRENITSLRIQLAGL
jgi:hypothetical protein